MLPICKKIQFLGLQVRSNANFDVALEKKINLFVASEAQLEGGKGWGRFIPPWNVSVYR